MRRSRSTFGICVLACRPVSGSCAAPSGSRSGAVREPLRQPRGTSRSPVMREDVGQHLVHAAELGRSIVLTPASSDVRGERGAPVRQARPAISQRLRVAARSGGRRAVPANSLCRLYQGTHAPLSPKRSTLQRRRPPRRPTARGSSAPRRHSRCRWRADTRPARSPSRRAGRFALGVARRGPGLRQRGRGSARRCGPAGRCSPSWDTARPSASARPPFDTAPAAD